MFSEFTLFPELPKELRFEIWKLATKEPRIVEICQFSSPREPNPTPIEGHTLEEEKDDEEENEYVGRKNPNPFYSPAALPAILHVNQESRTIALEHYRLSFANARNPATIYWNPAVDTLYFPIWCWSYNLTSFERATTKEVKDSIQRVAIDNLVWYEHWDEGTINGQIQIKKYGNLEEFYIVTRHFPTEEFDWTQSEVDPPPGAFTPEFDGTQPEVGKVEFVVSDEDADFYVESGRKDVKEAFEAIKKDDPKWKIPKFKFIQSKRGGVLV
jgi:hypothetical protein